MRRHLHTAGNRGLRGLLLAASLLALPLQGLSQESFVFAAPASVEPNHLPHLSALGEATSPFRASLPEAMTVPPQSSSFDRPAPDLPTEPAAAAPAIHPAAGSGGTVAPRDWFHVPAGWQAVPLGPHDKMMLAVHDLYSFQSFASILSVSGYSHLVNGQPNFGTDRGAFGQRLGAAAIRDSSQGLLSTGLFASLLHEDPRYYVEGPGHGMAHRVLYAVTRPLLTRSDEGNTTINGALLLGYGSAAALTPLYYPASNRNAKDVICTFGASLGGSAIGNVINEFATQVLAPIHLRHSR